MAKKEDYLKSNEFTIKIKVEGSSNENKEIGDEESGNSKVKAPIKKASKTQGSKFAQQISYQAIQHSKAIFEEHLEVSGNTTFQKDWNNFSAVASPLIEIGIGFAVGGWVGGAIATARVAVGTTIDEVRANRMVRQQNYAIDYAYQATGNASTMGSRYTYD